MGRIRAEGVGRPGDEVHAREAGGTRVSVETGEGQRAAGQAGNEQIVADGAGDGAGNGERGTIGAGAGDGPGLRSAEDERGADEHRAGVVVDGDAGGGTRRGDREGARRVRTALGDGDARDARRGRRETQRADGEVAVEGGDVGRGRRARSGAEDEVVRDAREALGIDGAGGVGREVGVVVGVIERRPADVGAHAPIEVGRQGRGGQGDRGRGTGQREGVAAEGAQVAERERRGIEAAGGGDEVIRTGGQAGQAGQVEDDAVGGQRRGRRADPVEGGEAADVKAERRGTGRAGAEVELAGAEVDGLADGVVEVEDRPGADADRRGAQGGGASAGDVEATAEDGGLTDVRKRRARKRERADPVLDEADVVLVDAEAADGAVEVGEDVLVDREGRQGRGAADEGVVGDGAETTDEDGSGVAAATGNGHDRSEARTVAAGVGDGEAGDDTAGDGRHGLRALRAHEAADRVEADDRRRGEGLTRVEDGDVRGLDAGDAGEGGDRLIAGAVGVTELEDGRAVARTDEEVRGCGEAIIRAAGQDETTVGHGRGTGEGIDARQGQRAVTRLGQAAGAGARGAADRTRQGEVVGGDVDGAASGEQADRAGGNVVSEARQEAQGAAGETEDTRGAADVIKVRDGEDAFVDGGLTDATAGGIVAGEDEGSATGLGDMAGRSQRRGDSRGEARRDRRGRRVDDVEDVFVRGRSVRSRTRQQDTAIETTQGDRILRTSRSRRVEGEEEGAAAERQAGAGGAGDSVGRRSQSAVVIMEDERVDRGAGRDREVGREHFTDIDGVADSRVHEGPGGEGRVVGGEVEIVEAGRGDVAHQRVTHVGLGDRTELVRETLTDEPG